MKKIWKWIVIITSPTFLLLVIVPIIIMTMVSSVIAGQTVQVAPDDPCYDAIREVKEQYSIHNDFDARLFKLIVMYSDDYNDSGKAVYISLIETNFIKESYEPFETPEAETTTPGNASATSSATPTPPQSPSAGTATPAPPIGGATPTPNEYVSPSGSPSSTIDLEPTPTQEQKYYAFLEGEEIREKLSQTPWKYSDEDIESIFDFYENYMMIPTSEAPEETELPG